MQNQFVFTAGKSLVNQMLSGGVVKGLGQPRGALPRLSSDWKQRDYSDRSVSLFLPGLGKLPGSFKEEQYFRVHEHMLVAQLQQADYRLKCENSGITDWKEFERMANACTEITALRQSGQLSKYKNCPEESFFLQEQRSLLERILDALRRLFANRGMGSPYPPPFGSGYYPQGPHYYQANKENEENKDDENKDNKDEDDGATSRENENENEKLEKDEKIEDNTEEKQDTDNTADDFGGRGDESRGDSNDGDRH